MYVPAGSGLARRVVSSAGVAALDSFRASPLGVGFTLRLYAFVSGQSIEGLEYGTHHAHAQDATVRMTIRCEGQEPLDLGSASDRIRMISAHGSGGVAVSEWWLTPLPVTGVVGFDISVPVLDLAGHVEVEGSALRDLAALSIEFPP